MDGPLSLDWLLHGRALSFLLFFLNFFPLESVVVWAWTQPLRWVQGQDPPDFPVGLILPSKVQGLIQVLQKGGCTSGAVGRVGSGHAKTLCPVLEPFFWTCRHTDQASLCSRGFCFSQESGQPYSFAATVPFLKFSPSLGCLSSPCHPAYSFSCFKTQLVFHYSL